MLTPTRPWFLGLTVGLALGAVLGAATVSRSASSRGTPSTLQTVLDLVSGLRQPSNGETRLLFPYVSVGGPGFTEINIFNTGRDPYGTTGTTAGCDVLFYGTVGTTHGTETARAVPAIEPGRFLSWGVAAGNVSTGGPESLIDGLPTFVGYAIATCGFPLAHGQVIRSDGVTTWPPVPAIILPSTRTTSFVEAGGH